MNEVSDFKEVLVIGVHKGSIIDTEQISAVCATPFREKSIDNSVSITRA